MASKNKGAKKVKITSSRKQPVKDDAPAPNNIGIDITEFLRRVGPPFLVDEETFERELETWLRQRHFH
jgi:hypothetical protein